jgi:hypothetical protein
MSTVTEKKEKKVKLVDEKKITHREWEKENSLTSTSDRNPDKKYKPNQGHPDLTETEVVHAVNELNDNTFVRKFLRVERRYADPIEATQRIGLISFVPAKGASPNDKGVYGFAKLRGNYHTDVEASERAELLIRTTDSYHKIFHAYVGRPFPLTLSSEFSDEIDEIELRKTMTESVSASIKKKKKEESQEIREIQEREKALKDDVKRTKEDDPLDHYTMLRVKKAQITWTYLETMKNIENMKEIIIKTRTQIEEMDKEDISYSEGYFKNYCDARSETGLDNSENKETFMKFLVEDAELDF